MWPSKQLLQDVMDTLTRLVNFNSFIIDALKEQEKCNEALLKRVTRVECKLHSLARELKIDPTKLGEM